MERTNPINVHQHEPTRQATSQQHVPTEDPARSGVVDEIESSMTKYVILPPAARLPVALWVVATHLADSFDAFPYICLSSPVPQCGKTRTLELMEFFVARPWRGTGMTEATLFRYVQERKPTLLLDEVESLAKRFASDRDTALLALLNAGYRKGQTVPRCEGNGKTFKLREFSVYGPKAFAVIGHLPATLADRSIIVPMQRKAKSDWVARFRFDRAMAESLPTKAVMEQAVARSAKKIVEQYRTMPELEFLSDRDDELFSPLFAICAVLAEDRLDELAACADQLCNAKHKDSVDDSLPMKLLADIRSIPLDGMSAVLTRDLKDALLNLQDSVWRAEEMKFNERKLAWFLRPFDVRPRPVRFGEQVGRGYVIEELTVAFDRYLPPEDKADAC